MIVYTSLCLSIVDHYVFDENLYEDEVDYPYSSDLMEGMEYTVGSNEGERWLKCLLYLFFQSDAYVFHILPFS